MTSPIGDTEARLRPGHHGTVESRSPTRSFMIVFEDDGETGYAYALDLSREHGSKIADAVQIYTVQEEFGDISESVVRLLWSPEGDKSAVELDGQLHAVFDFEACSGWSLSGFPPANGGWRRIRARSAAQLKERFTVTSP